MAKMESKDATVLTASLYDTSSHETNTSGPDPALPVLLPQLASIHRGIDIDRFGFYKKYYYVLLHL
jgi:hypothetical protein